MLLNDSCSGRLRDLDTSHKEKIALLRAIFLSLKHLTVNYNSAQ